jgi:hypothetical protein
LERQDKSKRIRFVDIADIDYDPMANMGVVGAAPSLAGDKRGATSRLGTAVW